MLVLSLRLLLLPSRRRARTRNAGEGTKGDKKNKEKREKKEKKKR